MLDLIIFGFGSAVTLVIGSALTTLILVKNRALDTTPETNHSLAAPQPSRRNP